MLALPYDVVLASASPRRRELLSTLIEDFRIDPADVDERVLEGETPWETAVRLAADKALTALSRTPRSLAIGGDTVVALPEGPAFAQLAKPVDEEDARRMLARLSGRTHLVVTGICFAWPWGCSAGADTSRVTFRTLSDDEIRAYVATGEPMDKAGSYGVQGGAQSFVTRIEGSVENVIGLPVEMLERMLIGQFGHAIEPRT